MHLRVGISKIFLSLLFAFVISFILGFLGFIIAANVDPCDPRYGFGCYVEVGSKVLYSFYLSIASTLILSVIFYKKL